MSGPVAGISEPFSFLVPRPFCHPSGSHFENRIIIDPRFGPIEDEAVKVERKLAPKATTSIESWKSLLPHHFTFQPFLQNDNRYATVD